MNLGVFNDEGLICAGWATREEAQAWVDSPESGCADDPEVYIAEVCRDHESQPADACELCAAEEDEEVQD